MIQKHKLKNGIPVFIVESHASPVVSIQAWVSRGSAHEDETVAGISHFLEHALFKGTKKRKVGEIALEIESRGGEVNAFTSFEETAYYATLASRYFSDGLDVIADALQNPSFDAEEMAREREVILEEIKRAHDSPFKMVSTNLWGTAFKGTPFGRPVLGFEKTVRKIDHRSLKSYHSKQYHAGSVSVFIVGDVDAKKALAAVEKKFGKMPRRPARTALKTVRATKSAGIRIIPIARDLKECQIQVGFPVPSIGDPSIPAIDLLCSAIGQGESSRLYQRLVKEKHLALEAHMGLASTASCGLATLTLVTAPETLVQALAEAWDVLEEAATLGIDDSEVERVKSSLEAEVISGKETVDGYARRLGYYYIQFGDPDYERKYLDALLAVDAEQAQKAIAGILLQKPVVSLAHPSAYVPDKEGITAALRTKMKTVDPKKVAAKTNVDSDVPRLEKHDGVRFVSKRISTLPIVAMRLLFPGGSREEKPNKYGLANLFQRCWTSGTKSFSSFRIAQTLESHGASVYSFAGKHTMGLSIECLPKHWPIIRPIVEEVLLNPTFPEDEFATEKDLLLREILSEKDSPGQVCQLGFLSALYGDHPYGRSSIGTQATVSSITTDDLKSFYRDLVHRGGLVASTVGAFDKNHWTGDVGSILKGLPATGKAPTPSTLAKRADKMRFAIAQKEPLFQSHLLIGFLGATLKTPERYALKLLSSCLAGQGGRLFLELRDKQSLAYTVSPMSSDSPDGGIFAFYIGCGPEKLERAIRGIRIEIEKVLEAPMPAKELERAKQYWIGRFELDMQRFASQAMLFGLDEVYDVGFDHALQVPEIIRALTAESIQSAARKYFEMDQATMSVVHPTLLTEEQLRNAWEKK